MKRTLGLSLVLATAFAGTAVAQGTISDGTATFARTGTPFDTTPSANFTGVSTTLTQDHLFETGWWFRVAGDSREFPFPVPDSQSYVGASSQLQWNDVNARGLFSAVEFANVVDTTSVYGTPSGYVRKTMQITNLSGSSTLDLELFHFVDFDVNGAGSDSATLVEWSPLAIIEITDPSGNTAQYLADAGWTGYMVTAFGANDVAAQLSDTAVTNFTNTGLPFGPADFVGGWQFSLSIPPGSNASAVVFLMVNATGHCANLFGILCDGVESGDTSIWTSAVP